MFGIKQEPLSHRLITMEQWFLLYFYILIFQLKSLIFEIFIVYISAGFLCGIVKDSDTIAHEVVRVIANSWNLHENKLLIERVVNSPYRTVCLTYGDYDIDNCIQVKGDFWTVDNHGIVRPNLTDLIPHTIKRY